MTENKLCEQKIELIQDVVKYMYLFKDLLNDVVLHSFFNKNQEEFDWVLKEAKLDDTKYEKIWRNFNKNFF